MKIGDCTVQRMLFADDLVQLDHTKTCYVVTPKKGFRFHALLSERKSVQQKQKLCARPANQSSDLCRLEYR